MKKQYSLLIIILALAAVIRLFQLNTLPISLSGDEIDIGYQAYSLIKTGRDYFGNFLPVYFHSLSEYRMPALVYLTAPITALFGLSAFSVRILPSLFGIANVFQIYLLVKTLFRDQKQKFTLALFAALILTILPWHLHYSRAAFDVTLQMFVILSGLLILLRGNLLGFSLLAFSFYIYPTSVVFVPLLCAAYFVIYKPQIRRSLIIPALILVPFVFNLFSGISGQRFGGLSVLNDSKIFEKIVTLRTEPWAIPGFSESFFHNKIEGISSAFIQNYVSAFSPEFLFISGDPNFRQSIGGFGEFYLISTPFLLLGLYWCFQNRTQKPVRFIISWLIVSPIAAALTRDGGMHATRLFPILFPLVIITALGVWQIVSLKNKVTRYSVLGISFLILIVSFTLYSHHYLVHYRFESARAWQYGYEDIFRQLSQVPPADRRVFINNVYEPALIRFAFYTSYPPSDFQKYFTNDLAKHDIVPGFFGFTLDNRYYFGEMEKGVSIDKILKPEDIYLAVQLFEADGDWDWSVSPPQTLKILGSTKNVFKKPLFYLVTPK